MIDNFKDWLSCDWSSLGDFFLWFCQGIGYLLVLFACWIILNGIVIVVKKMFKRNDASGVDFRNCCLIYLVAVGIPVILGVGVGYCGRKDKREPYPFLRVTADESRPWSRNQLDKKNIDDVERDDTVFICTSENSRRFHSTLSCPGMSNCNSSGQALTRDEAEDMGRTFCHRCYY